MVVVPSSELLWRDITLVWNMVGLYLSCDTRCRYRSSCRCIICKCPWSLISHMYSLPIHSLTSPPDVYLGSSTSRGPQREETLWKVPKLGSVSWISTTNINYLSIATGCVCPHANIPETDGVSRVSDVRVWSISARWKGREPRCKWHAKGKRVKVDGAAREW